MKTSVKIILLLTLMAVCPSIGHAIKITHGPYLQDVGETEATIVWVSDATSVGWVEIAPDDGSNFYAVPRTKYFDSHIGIKRESLIHAVTVKGLQPGTKYRYRIYSKEVLSHKAIRVHYGDVAATDVFNKLPLTFTTNNRRKADMSFVMVNDIHGDKARLAKLLDKSDYKKRDMVIFNGDMMSIFDTENKMFDGFMDTAVVKFASEQPLYYVRGNHETRGQLASRFHDYVCPNKPNLYFTVRQGPVLFICLDTGEDKPDDDIEYAGITDYDNYRTEQAEWLKQVVASDEFKDAKFRVVIAHIPPRYTSDAWHGDIDVREKFVPILNNAGIHLMLCGHLHQFVYNEPSVKANFPILTNSNVTAVAAETHGDKLDVKVLDVDGKITFSKSYQR